MPDNKRRWSDSSISHRPIPDRAEGRAEFLLSWWNPPNCGGFNLTTLWGVDTQIAADMVTVFAFVASFHRYRTTLAMVRSSGELSTLGARMARRLTPRIYFHSAGFIHR